MDDSFVLLSSMSPKINKAHKKFPRKVPTLLALKKNVRRSSILDDLPNTEKRNSLILAESSTTNSTGSSGTDKIGAVKETSIIVISDSDTSESGTSLETKVNHKLSASKVNAINAWISNVNVETGRSLVPSSDSDLSDNASSDLQKPVNSTFDKLFQSYIKSENFKTPRGSIRVDSTSGSSSSDGSTNASLHNAGKRNDVQNDSICETSQNVLDELYGNNWRNIKDVFSEPRCRRKMELDKREPKTEMKDKLKFLHKNPYLDAMVRTTPVTVRTISERTKAAWTKNLASLCDSDSSDPGINDIVNKYVSPKAKLDFGSREKNKNNRKANNWYDWSINSSAYDVSIEKPRKVQNAGIELSSEFSDDSTSLAERLKKKLVLKEKDDNIRLDTFKDVKGKKTKDSKVNRNIFPDKEPSVTVKKKVELEKPSKKTQAAKSSKGLNASTSYSFLASLSKSVKTSQCDPSARVFRNNFQAYKSELQLKLFKLYNDKVFDKVLPEDDTPIEWNDKMKKTAGFCYCRKISHRSGEIQRKARIVLSTKVVDSADRLRDTLIHELCHAATWIVNQVANGHGDHWKAWAHKARQVFPELPPIKRCHDYVINTKYTYRCVDCGYSIGRHSKSLDIERKRCGHCYGKFEILINKKSKDGETRCVPVTPKKTPTGFALFVKENYAVYKTAQLNHGQVMRLLGQKFNELKVTIIKD